MLAAIDLTHRQATRVLEQAVRTHAGAEIEPRSGGGTVRGSFGAREADLLSIRLNGDDGDAPLTALVGCFCEVKTVLSGNLYYFSTCIVDAGDRSPGGRLLLAVPDVVQVYNRRRFDRQTPAETAAIQLWPADARQAFTGTLNDIGLAGLSCRLPRAGLDEALLIDDEVRIRFQLPGGVPPFDLMAIVCVKTPVGGGQHLNVGLQFLHPAADEPACDAVTRLQAVLTRDYLGFSKTDDQS